MGAQLARESAGRGRRGRAGAGFRRAGRDRLRAGSPASRSSSASSATTMSAAPSSSRPRRSANLGVRLKHSANRAVVDGKRIVLIDDSSGARHHLGEDRADDARRRRQGSAFPHRLAADHASRLLRHRHARARQAARRHPRRSRRCARSSARIRWRSCRSTASTAPWASAGRDPARPQFTDHCFTGDYPTPLTDQTAHETAAAATVAAGRGELTYSALAQ